MIIRVPGKWVLAGEHAVLRGGSAVVFAHQEWALTLTQTPSDHLEVIASDSEAVLRVLARLQLLATEPAELTGIIKIESTIPEGAGAGSSAALCVALVRAFGPVLKIGESREWAVARELENEFHGQSSGMDVAAVMHASKVGGLTGPIRFSSARGARPIHVHARYQKDPLRFEFYDTGIRAKTSDCIARVNEVRLKQAGGSEIDVKMAGAAEHAAFGLENGDTDAIIDAIQSAQSCFDAWGLTPEPVAKKIAELRASGLRAVKMTGSGGGGILVGLRV